MSIYTNHNMLFIGDLNPLSNASKFYRALVEMGNQVFGISTTLASRSVFSTNAYSKLDALLYRLGYPTDNARTNQQVLEYLNKGYRPDIVWIFSAPVLRAKTIRSIRHYSPNSKLVFLSFDNHLKSHHRTRTVTENLGLVDIVFIIQRGANDKSSYKKLFHSKQVEFFDFGYDRNTIFPRQMKADPNDFTFDVIFIGTYEVQRAKELVYLANNGINVTVFGGLWHTAPRWVRQSPLKIEYRTLHGKDFVLALHRSKIALNFLRKINDDLSTTRTFEIPASGTFMLAERSLQHKMYYREGLEAEYFDTSQELLKKTKYYLEHHTEREKIAQNGLLRTQTSEYDFHSQLNKMLTIINQYS